MTVLGGGWGYNNLGDEAILAGYLETVSSIPHVHSVNPTKTFAAQLAPMQLSSEKQRTGPSNDDVFLLCGGGYINGSWVPEVNKKLGRLNRLKRNHRIVAHGIELRSISGRTAAQLSTLLDGAAVAVRDEESRLMAREIGIQAEVLPDSIALLSPHIEKYSSLIESVRGRVLLNLLDITRRPDSREAEIPVERWRRYCKELVYALGDKALAIDVGSGDRTFADELRLDVIKPSSVAEMVSLIASVDGLVSVRMHPALIGTILGTPTVSIPYCGKVSPTLRAIGVDSVIQYDLDVDYTMSRLEHRGSWDQQWSQAAKSNQQWLNNQDVIAGLAD